MWKGLSGEAISSLGPLCLGWRRLFRSVVALLRVPLRSDTAFLRSEDAFCCVLMQFPNWVFQAV